MNIQLFNPGSKQRQRPLNRHLLHAPSVALAFSKVNETDDSVSDPLLAIDHPSSSGFIKWLPEDGS